MVDRRITPSHGYRAVHVIVHQHGIPVEVQVRTELEHSWAQLSEKLSDVVDPSVKYGGGPELLKSRLLRISEAIGTAEELESRLLRTGSPTGDLKSIAMVSEFAEIKQQLKDLLNEMIEQGVLWQDEEHAVPNPI